MKNYKNSSYAANKYSKDIVYNSEVSGSTAISLEDFLKSDPTLTESDFEFWKNWSDKDYLEEARDDNRHSWKCQNLSCIDKIIDHSQELMEEIVENEMLEDVLHTALKSALEDLYNDRFFTRIMKDRFEMYFYKGMSTIEISIHQNVNSKSVAESVNSALNKLKRYFSLKLQEYGIEI